MTASAPRLPRRYRRRIFGWGAVVAAALFAIGAPVVNGRIERDLERRVPGAIEAVGVTGVRASFSGQGGTLFCEAALSDPQRVLDVAYAVRGVRAVELDRSCRVGGAPTTEPPATGATTRPTSAATSAASTSSTSTTVDFPTVGDVVATDPQLTTLSTLVGEAGLADELAGTGPLTLFAPVNAAFEGLAADALAAIRQDPELLATILRHHIVPQVATTDELATGALPTLDDRSLDMVVTDGAVSVGPAAVVGDELVAGNGVVHLVDQIIVPDDVELPVAVNEPTVAASLADGRIRLAGTVADAAQRERLLEAAVGAVGADAVDDALEVVAGVEIAADRVDALATLIAAMPAHLLAGEIAFAGATVRVGGVALTRADAAAFDDLAATVGATSELTVRPPATAEEAAELEAQLNTLVQADPVEFERGRAELAAESAPVLDRIAELATTLDGVTITIEGHTDSEGTESDNRTLSVFRAAVVRDALIARGVPGESLAFEGRGEDEPIIVDGVEDSDASRRVEFRVAATG